MLSRASGYLRLTDADVPQATEHLQREGWALLEGVFDEAEIAGLRREIDAVFDQAGPDHRNERRTVEEYEPFRYEMVNRSAAVRRAAAHPAILATVEPLLGEDCHLIACTAWRQPPDENRHGGRFWHIDAGPHVPRPEGVDWDERIPYPVFAIAAHVYLIDCPVEAGPTGVIPRSHTSGQAPPNHRVADDGLTWNGVGALTLPARAGDVVLFASDVWHRRMPSHEGDPGRYFQQFHYGRRDIAQRIRPTAEVNHLSPEAESEADGRLRRLLGLHPTGFYDG